MSVETILAFCLASAVILFIPGPTVLLVVGLVAQHGRRAVGPLASGVVLGDLVAMSLSLAGLGAIMSTSATLFVLIKWCGGLYLIWLAITQWRMASQMTAVSDKASRKRSRAPGRMLRDAFLVTVFNPKSLLFFLAFMPQFVTHDSALWPQFVVLGSLFLLMTLLSVCLYGFFADALFRHLRSARLMKRLKQLGAACLATLGLATVTVRTP